MARDADQIETDALGCPWDGEVGEPHREVA